MSVPTKLTAAEKFGLGLIVLPALAVIWLCFLAVLEVTCNSRLATLISICQTVQPASPPKGSGNTDGEQ